MNTCLTEQSLPLGVRGKILILIPGLLFSVRLSGGSARPTGRPPALPMTEILIAADLHSSSLPPSLAPSLSPSLGVFWQRGISLFWHNLCTSWRRLRMRRRHRRGRRQERYVARVWERRGDMARYPSPSCRT